MRKMILGLAGLICCGSLAAAVNPRQNPDDQFRFFWLYNPATLNVLADSGFNLFINSCFGAYSVDSGIFDARSVAARKEWMDAVLAKGLDYVEQVSIPQHRTFVAKYPRILKDGSEHKFADMSWSVAMDAALKGVRTAAKTIERHPACIGVEPSSEVRDHSCPSFRPECVKAYTDATGEPIPPEVVDKSKVGPHYLQVADFPVSRVVDEDYRLMKFYTWFWRVGDGWNNYQTRTGEIFREELGRDMLVMYDPVVRVPPLWGSGGKLTHNNQWTYPTPDPYNIHYVISEQQAMARGVPGQKVMSMVQAISYRSRLAPKEQKVENEPQWVRDRPNTVYMTTPPDIMREALWATFAHQMDGIGVFAWRALFDAASGEWGEKRDPLAADYQFTNPETIGVISNVFNRVGKRFGPLFKAIPERAPEVAMLESYASTFFANRGSWGWDGQIYLQGIIADAAHLQPYVLYEEEIARDGIPETVKVILAPHCDVLTRTTFTALKAFQARGGLIVADGNLVPGILPDLSLPQFQRVGRQGDKYDAELHRCAAELKETLKPFYRPPSDSDNDHIVTFVRSYKSSDYVFAINDKREFGDYVGQWKLIMERGCENEGTVTVRRKTGAVYDLVKHTIIPHKILPNGDTEVNVRYLTNDGKCLLFTDKPLGPLAMEVKGSRIRVTSEDRDVLVPIAILVKGHPTRFAVIKDGEYVWDAPFEVKGRVRVVNMADGVIYESEKVAIYHDGWIDLNKNGIKDVYEDSAAPVAARVQDLVGQMNVDEKVGQLVTLYGTGRVLENYAPTDEWDEEVWRHGLANIDEELNGVGPAFKERPDLLYPYSNHVAAVRRIQRWFVEETRLGIPVDFSNEGIHGLNHTKATPLPAPIAIGSTWNRGLVREAGAIVGREAKLIGYSNVYAPILDVARDPRWGRVLECYGEDPYLVGALGLEMCRGIQAEGVAATLKHYAAYSVPKGGRDADCRTDPHITPRELHEIFLSPFARVIREAKPMGVMCSYNDWNGEPIASSRWFLFDLLRGTYGFDGSVVSDSDAVEFVQTKHQVAATYEEAVAKTVAAGLNVRTRFGVPDDFTAALKRAIAQGLVSVPEVDARVAEVLSVKFRLGLFDNPYLGDAENADRLAGADKQGDFVERLQAESMVLLKNDGGVLPLTRGKIKKLLVTGPLADHVDVMSSRYGPNGLKCESVLEGLKTYLGSDAVIYHRGCETVDARWPTSEILPEPPSAAELAQIDEAVAESTEVDAIVAVLGEDTFVTGESRSRTSLELPGRQQLLLEKLVATGKPVVLVLINGQPLTVNWAAAHVSAILEAWFPGPKGGAAVAKTLFGEINPSGKLTVTFPKAVGQIEYNFPYKKGSHGKQNRLGDPNGSGVTRVVGPLYPFGHGLSYTDFRYSDLKIVPERGSATEPRRISFTVTNVGTCAGAEVVQLYVRDEVSSVVTYDSVLRGFDKVALQPGESKVVEMELKPEDLQILDQKMEWSVESGRFQIRIGASSEDIRLQGVMTVL